LSPLELPRRHLSEAAEAERLLERAQAEYRRLRSAGAPHGPVRTAECAVFGAEGAVVLARAQQSGELERVLAAYQTIEAQGMLIGDTAVIGLPGEVFCEYALEIKRRAPMRSFVVSLVNGELQGYVVTPRAAAVGGYEAAYSLFTPDAGAVLVEAALKLIGALREQSPKTP
jgi:hypothetical protein